MTTKGNRLFFNAVIGTMRTGYSWADLPERFGQLNSVCRHFRRLAQKDVWEAALQGLQAPDPDGGGHARFNRRAGPPAFGRLKKRRFRPRAPRPQPGDFTTKLHLSCDIHGRICALALTGGRAGDCPQAPGLLCRHLRAGQAVLADWAYNADYVRVQIAQAGAVAVIPGKKNRVMPGEHDAEICKEQNQIRRAINGLKRLRAVATRFDKRAANYFAICYLIATSTRLLL